jgi:multidrug efflux pump subunit AcrB
VQGTRDRLLPLVTAAAATAAVAAPLAFSGGRAGFELLAPAAIAVLGGLVTATVVTLFIVPVVMLRLGPGPDHDSWIDELYEPATGLEPAKA